MSLTVLSIAYPFAPVGPDAVGGAEQVLSHLDHALINDGHQSIVIASEDSRIAGIHLNVPRPDGPITSVAKDVVYREVHSRIHYALENWEIDLIHLHGIDFERTLPEHAETPILITLHLPPEWYHPDCDVISKLPIQFQCVSRSQSTALLKTSWGAQICERGQFAGVIENGVPPPPRCRTRDRGGASRNQKLALSLGRICPEKGFHLALDAAKKASHRMILAGKVFPYASHEEYFRTEILPRLDPERTFFGPASLQQKWQLLSRARCLLVPSLVAETSSLVAMEAMSAGVPVVAFSNGALPELIDEGRTGFLVQNEMEMAHAIEECQRLKPEDCIDTARERFSVERMASDYIHLYSKVARCGSES